MNHRHTIEISETDEGVVARITNEYTRGVLFLSLDRDNYDTRDEMIGDLFAGPLPNIRDCYDSDAWVMTPTQKEKSGE